MILPLVRGGSKRTIHGRYKLSNEAIDFFYSGKDTAESTAKIEFPTCRSTLKSDVLRDSKGLRKIKSQ